MSTFNWWMRACTLFLLLAATVVVLPAQTVTFKTLKSFDGTDGAYPYAALVQATNGNLYGTTDEYDVNYGTVFEISPSGTLTTLHSFVDDTGGHYPYAGLVQATNGNFYGTTYAGEAGDEHGTVFEITPTGALTTRHSFAGYPSDGAYPYAGLVQGTDGNLYGTTSEGGKYNAGTVFEITPSGKLTILHSFDITDGQYPESSLVQGANGNFYGTTVQGGTKGYGTIFEIITSTGKLTTLQNFSIAGADGQSPYAGLILGTDGNLYGTTWEGGTNPNCPNPNGCGTVFRLTPSGKLTTLHSFDYADGELVHAGLVQGTDGNLYGTTQGGGIGVEGDHCGDEDCGTVFEISTDGGKLTTLYRFCLEGDCPDGSAPIAALVQDTDGSFYGTTEFGANTVCSEGCGTVFSLSVGLEPFVKIQTTSGEEGAKIGILGQGFSSSSVVKFGGTKATTIVLSGTTFITATVPAGGLTGSVTVTTGTTTLTSAKTFDVLPTITSFTPESGPVGTSVTIKGTGLKQTTKVTFDGKSATVVTVDSDTEVTADVPTDATTGKIAVTTKGGSATSATSFTVN